MFPRRVRFDICSARALAICAEDELLRKTHRFAIVRTDSWCRIFVIKVDGDSKKGGIKRLSMLQSTYNVKIKESRHGRG